MKHSTGQRGSVTVESAIALSAIISLVGGGLVIVYISFASVWIDRASYETAICLSTNMSRQSCEERLRFETSAALPLGRIRQLNLERSPSHAAVHLSFAFAGHQVLENRQFLRLPLNQGGLREVSQQ